MLVAGGVDDGQHLLPLADAYAHRPAPMRPALRSVGHGVGQQDVALGLVGGEVAFLDATAGGGIAVELVGFHQRRPCGTLALPRGSASGMGL